MGEVIRSGPTGGRVEKSRRNRQPGRVVRIDLGDDVCAYGRQLLHPAVEFFARRGRIGEAVDLLDIARSPVAFQLPVTDRAFRRNGPWELLDVVTLSAEEEAAVYQYSKLDAISQRLSIYWVDAAAGTFGEIPASAEQCVALERLAVWDAEEVEERLRDYFANRANRLVERLRAQIIHINM